MGTADLLVFRTTPHLTSIATTSAKLPAESGVNPLAHSTGLSNFEKGIEEATLRLHMEWETRLDMQSEPSHEAVN